MRSTGDGIGSMWSWSGIILSKLGIRIIDVIGFNDVRWDRRRGYDWILALSQWVFEELDETPANLS